MRGPVAVARSSLTAARVWPSGRPSRPPRSGSERRPWTGGAAPDERPLGSYGRYVIGLCSTKRKTDGEPGEDGPTRPGHRQSTVHPSVRSRRCGPAPVIRPKSVLLEQCSAACLAFSHSRPHCGECNRRRRTGGGVRGRPVAASSLGRQARPGMHHSARSSMAASGGGQFRCLRLSSRHRPFHTSSSSPDQTGWSPPHPLQLTDRPTSVRPTDRRVSGARRCTDCDTMPRRSAGRRARCGKCHATTETDTISARRPYNFRSFGARARSPSRRCRRGGD